jgi:predicted lipid-binding transport protein (Tim44 family)
MESGFKPAEETPMLRTHRPLLALLAVMAALVFTVVSVDARSSGSSGSRGGRTFSAPAATHTAPRAAPIERSMAQPARPGTAATQTTGAAGQAARPGLFGGMFGGGLLGGLAAGFLGAGLFGMLSGSGFMGGMGGFASMLGLLLQIGLVVIIAKLAWNWWQRRNQPATAAGPSLRDNLSSNRPNAGSFGGFGGGASAPAPADLPVEVTPADFDKFEKLLGDIQTAYGKEDLAALRAHVTPEMLSYFSEELARNASRGVVNQISDVKLLQGDLSEAWREINDDYATVAMRYSLNDKIVDRATGRVVEEEPSEATEFWTFRRAREGDWVLSAIQQT